MRIPSNYRSAEMIRMTDEMRSSRAKIESLRVTRGMTERHPEMGRQPAPDIEAASIDALGFPGPGDSAVLARASRKTGHAGNGHGLPRKVMIAAVCARHRGHPHYIILGEPKPTRYQQRKP